ncbi:MAG: LodA/GoxA family CTQ-dependent oxidase [Roseiflexaceae bacterium]
MSHQPGSPQDTTVVRAAIHPAIGVARVGDSPEGVFLGPQVADPPPAELGAYRDAQGALKRQAVEFRIYGYNAAGEVVGELTADQASIEWQVHIANRKATWYQWQIAMDIPEAADVTLPLRNAAVTDPTARAALAIDPGPRTISGTDSSGVTCEGAFNGTPVYLGELRTDAEGRLLFLGGRGVSASPTGTPIYNPSDPNTFINADGWYDDTSDGPVTALVTIGGKSIPVQGAWVVTAPPNYAPQAKAVRTLYDLLYDLYVQAGWLQAPQQISFSSDVYPLLQRLSGLQWVNQGFAVAFGFGGRYDFENPALLAQLSQLPPAGEYDPNAELRRQILNSFRPPSVTDSNQLPWPWLYGDAMEVPAGASPRQNATITATQYSILQRWAAGEFTPDWGKVAPYTSIDAVPLAEQPAMLDRAALEFCLADAFHPGCEMTWPMRHLTLYDSPFRISLRPAGQPEPDYGPTATQASLLAADGPLYQQGPGDISRWMGLPWQADTAYCRSGYDPDYDPYAPTFWPARVPNHVLTTQDYALVTNTDLPYEQRLQAFSQRTDWNAPLHGTIPQQMEQMVKIFGSMGLLEVHTSETPDFPAVMQVASFGPDVPASPPAQATLSEEATPNLKGQARKLPRGHNFASREEARQAPLPVRRSKK